MYCIKEGYIERAEPEYTVDEEDSLYQPDVYRAARANLDAFPEVNTVIDIGCGKAGKLRAFSHVKTIGIDIGDNMNVARKIVTEAVPYNLENGLPEIRLSVLMKSILICADVVEHLKDPSPMLKDLKDWMDVCPVAILSTPDRDRTHGPDHNGPPPNVGHVREWNRHEFADYLKQLGFHHHVVTWTRAHETHSKDDLKTICAFIWTQ